MTPISINTDTTIGIDIVDIWVDASAIRVRFYEPGVVHKAFRPLDLGPSFSPRVRPRVSRYPASPVE